MALFMYDHHPNQGHPTRRRIVTTLIVGLALLAACGSSGKSSATTSTTTAPPPTTAMPPGHEMGGSIDPADASAAMLATAAFQDVKSAEAAGYASSIDALGCFQDPAKGGMGVHYINQSLMDDKVDVTKPEALVYEMDADGEITGLVAHEYIVPDAAWTSTTPPTLFGQSFHHHPTLPLWVLHAWLWKDNPSGDFQDYNPAVRLCPAGVPIFGKDLPKPTTT